MSVPMVEICNLKKYFTVQDGRRRFDIRAIDGVNLTIERGEILGLVGESGSGKTTLARVLLGLTTPTEGLVAINGSSLSDLRGRKLKELRRDIAVVFQDPASNLNPRQTVESSIMRPLRIHGVSAAEAKERAAEALEKVKMDTSYLKTYPHQLSGGQLQRIAVARALVLRPKIMVLDEPTSALDISVQAQVLNLLLSLQEELHLTYLIITHDLNVIRYVADRLAVMYLGQLVEHGDAQEVFSNPKHPYTQGLMAAAPILDPNLRGSKPPRMKGEPGSLIHVGEGCRLTPRCPIACDLCKSHQPPLREITPGHFCACHFLAFH